MVGSAAIKQGRSANRKHTYFFFWPYRNKYDHHRLFLYLQEGIYTYRKEHYLVLFDYWIFHNRSWKIIGQEVLIDDRL